MQCAAYDRLIICGDIRGSGNCFALVFATQSESRTLMRDISGGIGIGSLIYVGEPKKCDSTLGPSMPIVKTIWQIIPLQMKLTVHLPYVLPHVPFQVPRQSGEHRYFVYHNKEIKLIGFRLVHDTVSCSGRYCDRSQVMLPNVSCGCMQVGFTRSPTVGEFSVELQLVSPGSVLEQKQIIQDFRSLRTTEYFFENLDDYGSQDGYDFK